MKKKQFKAESKKLLDLMINSIYTNKDIFLRELISNASDAIDKVHYNSLTDKSIKLPKELAINITIDKDNRKLTISDNGCGMNADELENNLGTIAESGSLLFKKENINTSIIGQFGVGFYSTFMVAKKVEVISRPYNSEKAYKWSSTGEDGYIIEETTKDDYGTDIILTLKEDDDNYKYSDYLETYSIKDLVTKYSNYISYPIKLKEDKDFNVINEMTPIWKKNKKKVKDEDYNNFYMSKFSDYSEPLKTIKYKVEGICEFETLLFIPSHTPYDFYSKNYKRGLELYSNGVMIMDNCEDLLPEQYNFVKGIVDSSDLSLNISREILQQDKQVKIIAKNISKKINTELKDMLANERDKYEQFYKEFGPALKIAIYNSFGSLKDELEDLLLFYSSKEQKYITLAEYVSKLDEQEKNIYYAVGDSISQIDIMPQVDNLKDKGYEILYLTDYADEFVLQVLRNYKEKEFTNVEKADLDLDTEEEKEAIEKINNDNKELLDNIVKYLNGKITKVKFVNNLKNHPVCLATEGNISNGMEKVINAMPNEQNITSNKVLLINANHKIADKIKNIYKLHSDELEKYAKVLYAEACLIEGLSIDNANEISDIIFELLSKEDK